MNVLLNFLLVVWGLLLIVKANNRSQRLTSRGLDQLRSLVSSEDET